MSVIFNWKQSLFHITWFQSGFLLPFMLAKFYHGFMISRFLGKLLSRYLQKTVRGYTVIGHTTLEGLQKTLRPGDVLLVEGNRRISTAIKYLTQSTWSHAAIYVGDAVDKNKGDPKCLIEADLEDGVRAVKLSRYAHLSTRICRPHNLSEKDVKAVIKHMTDSLGMQYDTKHIMDLMRYLIRQPPVPAGWRRRMLALGSGDPTRAICSSLIAQAFQKVEYPILPEIEKEDEGKTGGLSEGDKKEILHIRHHTLFTPRDFDLSPYFEVIKPTIENGFDYKSLHWAENKTNKKDENPVQ